MRLVRRIIALLPRSYVNSGGWVVATVPIRAILNLVGVAAFIPIITLVLDNNPTPFSPITICVVMIGVMVLKCGLNIIISKYQNRYMMGIYRYFSTSLFSNFYKKGLLYIKGRNSAEIAHEINGVCYSFSLGVLSPILNMAGELLLLIFIYVGLLIYSTMASLFLPLCFVPVVLVYVYWVKGSLTQAGREENDAKRGMWRTVLETFRGYSEIEVSQAFPTIQERFDKNLRDISRLREKITTIQQFPSSLIEISVVLGMIILLLFGKGEEGSNSTVTLGIFAVASLRMLPAVRTLANGWTTIKNNVYSLEVIEEGLRDRGEAQVPEKFEFNSQIEAIDLSFGYPDSGVSVFDHLSLTIKKGEKVGIRGHSGVGKTTLFNLLLGFYTPTNGEIKIDGKRLTPSNRGGWLALAGYVPQDVFILDGSLAENIALGVKPEEIEREKVLKVVKEASLDNFLSNLPEGIDSRIGEAGSKLSGGEKQRVGLARALYKGVDLLFLDEATSALDSATEREVNEAMSRLSESRKELTIIVIAHRESSLAYCDRVIDLA